MISFILRAFGWLATWVVLIFLSFVLYSWVREYSPSQIEPIAVIGDSQSFTADTFVVVSWNIGYAGLGADMDFFMDGGQSVQTSRGRTLENLREICRFLRDSCSDAHFILLQEVDRLSKRSYNINPFDTIVSRFGQQYRSYYAPNFRVDFVPIPLGSPIGAVDAGLMTLSRYGAKSAQRVSYPNVVSWPQRIFDLKRCLLSVEIPLGGQSSLYINNTHNSAYDDGGQREAEIVYLNSFLASKTFAVTAGDWNCNAPQYKPSKSELHNEYFTPRQLKTTDFPVGCHFAVDLTTYSVRYGFEPYDSTTTTRSVIDFAVSSPSVVPVEVKCYDQQFEASDHNPVKFTFVIKG